MRVIHITYIVLDLTLHSIKPFNCFQINLLHCICVLCGDVWWKA